MASEKTKAEPARVAAPAVRPLAGPGLGNGASLAGSRQAPMQARPSVAADSLPAIGGTRQRARTVYRLQQSAGNHRVGRLLGADGTLPVSRPEEPAEREADAVAQRVTDGQSAGPIVMRPTGIPRCDDHELAMRSPAGESPVAGGARVVPPGGPGRPLDPGTRRAMEDRFGRDFADVRVHTDPDASAAARAIDAHAYTVGSDIVLRNAAGGAGSPDTTRLLAHELTHVVQQGHAERASVQRQAEAGVEADAGIVADAGVPTDAGAATDAGGDATKFGDVLLSPDPVLIARVLDSIVAKHPWGIVAAEAFVTSFEDELSAKRAIASDISGVSEELDELRRAIERDTRIAQALRAHLDGLRDWLADFEVRATAVANAMLDSSEARANEDRIRYGITETQVEELVAVPDIGGGVGLAPVMVTEYGMQRASPPGRDLQTAAGVLLARRREIQRLQAEQDQHRRGTMVVVSYGADAYTWLPDEQYYAIGKQIEGEKQRYNQLRDYLSTQFPILAAFSEVEKSTRELETLAEKGPGPEMARVLGTEIATTMRNIAKAREGLKDGDVNVWRLPTVVRLTQAGLGAANDPVKARLVEWKVADEKPGIWQDIALLVLNVLAIALAAPTGGVSLAVAGAVNITVTVKNVQEFLLQEALSGSDFDKAQALSQEEPSLFWLALDIVGVLGDVGAVATVVGKSFKALAPLVKTALAAKEGKAAAEALEAVRVAARETGGARLAEQLVDHVHQLRTGGERAALEAVGATPKEAEALAGLAKTRGLEAAEEIAATAVEAAVEGGKITVTKAGHIFVCGSPCTLLRERYLTVFAKDEDLEKTLVRLEEHAREAAALQRTDPKAAAELAAQVKKDAKALELQIHRTHPDLVFTELGEEAVLAVKQAEAEAGELGGRVKELSPPPPKRPEGLMADDPRWRDYELYYGQRYRAITGPRAAGEAVPRLPLEFGAYDEFLGKFRRGTAFQKGVAETLEREKGVLFKDMADPVVESNVGVVAKAEKEAAGEVEKATTKYVDQLVVDRATIGPGKTPHIEVFSNKSRQFPRLAELDRLPRRARRRAIREITDQVLADADEALTKYGGRVELRRPTGPLKELLGQTVEVNKVTLVYDRAFVTDPSLEAIIRRAIAGRKGVEVVFLP
jgi:Domain of unknown function (DUF4157)